jgi:UDP-N-acetylglucosamine 1-carboxyvinyltransferase
MIWAGGWIWWRLRRAAGRGRGRREETNAGLKVARKNGRIRAVDVVTAPFPGFPTDLQAQMMALLCTPRGRRCWRRRSSRTASCTRPNCSGWGRIDVHGGTATVTGVDRLKGAPVMATDLRASVSLILAGLGGRGRNRGEPGLSPGPRL